MLEQTPAERAAPAALQRGKPPARFVDVETVGVHRVELRVGREKPDGDRQMLREIRVVGIGVGDEFPTEWSSAMLRADDSPPFALSNSRMRGSAN